MCVCGGGGGGGGGGIRYRRGCEHHVRLLPKQAYKSRLKTTETT